MLGGPLGYSIAPFVLKSKSLTRLFRPMAEWWANASGYRKYGLRYDDLIIEENPQVQKALSRLSPKESYDRVYRLRRLHQLSLMHITLPKEQWTKPEEDVRYLTPLIQQVVKEETERGTWDTMDVKVQK